MHPIDPVLKLKDVCPVIKRSASAINRDRRLGTFPAPLRLGARSVGWRTSDIQQWIADRERVTNARGRS